MKKYLLSFVFMLLPICLIAGSGDVNGDGKVNVTDIVELLNYLNGKPTKNYNASEADANNDGVVDKNDVKAIANIISSGNFSAVSYDIPLEQLNGWDDGMFFMSENSLVDNFYIVYKTNQEEDQEAVTICLNSANNEDTKRSVIFNFNKEGTLQDIILSGILFKAFSFTEEMFFVAYNNDGEILGSFSVPCDNIDLNTEYSLTRASRPRNRSIFRNSKGKISIPKIKEFAKKASPIAKKSIGAIQTAIKLDEGKYGDILLSFVVGGLVGLVDLPVLAAIIAEQGIEALLKYIYDAHREVFLGNAGIEITSIKRTSKTSITVEGKISNISSIPTIRIEPIFDILEEVTNVVYWGVAVGKSGQPGLYLNDNCSEIMPITSEDFSYTFYLDEVPGQILYFRPFLAPDFHSKKSSDNSKTIWEMAVTDIRYGERKEFFDMNVELSNFRQISCDKVNGQYQVQFTIDGKIPGIFDELASWGFQVSTKSGLVEQCWAKEASDYYPPLEKSFTCEIAIKENDIIESNGERIVEISIIPYVSFWNRSPSMQFFDSEKYTITLDGKSCPDSNHPHWIDLGLPSGTQWRCCNEGASTPEAYGGLYNFGEVASAPSSDQIIELLNYTTSEWTTQNGINGRRFTGSNGGSIFLPAAGIRSLVDGEIYWVGSNGLYWSSTSFGNGYVRDFRIDSDVADCLSNNPSNGLSVRPVR